MHIPNEFLDTRLSAGFGLASAGALAYCLSRVRQAVTSIVQERALATAGRTMSSISQRMHRTLSGQGAALLARMAMIGSIIFTAQAFDFPVAGGTTGHILGCALAAIALGPWAGGIVMAAVLAIQALFLGDGGLMALGANIFNMGIIGTVGAYFIYRSVMGRVNGPGRNYLSIAAASWTSVVAAAAFTALEVGISGTRDLSWSLNSMVSTHSLVGIAEAIATIAVLGIWKMAAPSERGQG